MSVPALIYVQARPLNANNGIIRDAGALLDYNDSVPNAIRVRLRILKAYASANVYLVANAYVLVDDGMLNKTVFAYT
jgi:hypothetical protein